MNQTALVPLVGVPCLNCDWYGLGWVVTCPRCGFRTPAFYLPHPRSECP